MIHRQPSGDPPADLPRLLPANAVSHASCTTLGDAISTRDGAVSG